jgi:hypothetical protein
MGNSFLIPNTGLAQSHLFLCATASSSFEGRLPNQSVMDFVDLGYILDQFTVMGHDDNGGAMFTQSAESIVDMLCAHAFKIARRLIRNYESGDSDEWGFHVCFPFLCGYSKG